MLNIALALAFLISAAASPGGRLLSTFFPVDALPLLPPYQQVLLSVLANYWLSAVLLYLALRATRADRYLRPDVPTHVVLGVANITLISYAGLRIFASTVEGGGATFAVVNIAAPIILVCRWALAAGIGWLAVRSFWQAIRKTSHRGAVERRPLLRTTSGLVATAMLLPPIAFTSWIYASHATGIRAALAVREARDDRFEEMCRNVRIEINRTVTGAQSVFFSGGSELVAPILKHVDYVEAGNAKRVVRYTKAGTEFGKSGHLKDALREEVSAPTAQYELSWKPLESSDDRALGLHAMEFTLQDRQTGEILAIFSDAMKTRGVLVVDQCPRELNNYRYKLTAYVLGLYNEPIRKRVADRIAAVQRRSAR